MFPDFKKLILFCLIAIITRIAFLIGTFVCGFLLISYQPEKNTPINIFVCMRRKVCLIKNCVSEQFFYQLGA